MKVSRVVGPALLGACLYGAVTNSYPTDAEKDAFGDAAATNAVGGSRGMRSKGDATFLSRVIKRCPPFSHATGMSRPLFAERGGA